jgi:hypothetical protein
MGALPRRSRRPRARSLPQTAIPGIASAALADGCHPEEARAKDAAATRHSPTRDRRIWWMGALSRRSRRPRARSLPQTAIPGIAFAALADGCHPEEARAKDAAATRHSPRATEGSGGWAPCRVGHDGPARGASLRQRSPSIASAALADGCHPEEARAKDAAATRHSPTRDRRIWRMGALPRRSRRLRARSPAQTAIPGIASAALADGCHPEEARAKDAAATRYSPTRDRRIWWMGALSRRSRRLRARSLPQTAIP